MTARSPWSAAAVIAVALAGLPSMADDIPQALLQAALRNYPRSLVCGIAADYTPMSPAMKPTQDVQQGFLHAYLGTLGPTGPQVAVVAYTRDLSYLYEEIFRLDGDSWVVMPVDGQADYKLVGGSFLGDDPVVFTDLDHDGVNEIVLDFRSHARHFGTPEAVIVLAYRNGGLVTITETRSHLIRNLNNPPRIPECQQRDIVIGPTNPFNSDTGIGFVDLDGDGMPELLVYPDLGRSPTDPDIRDMGQEPSTGTRVFKLVNGVYTFQYETPVGVQGMPPIGAAVKPASVPLAELEDAAKNPGNSDDKDQSLALDLMPPGDLTFDDVDWASLRVGDFKIAATGDRGVFPAPHPETEHSGWVGFDFMGQSMWLEQTQDKNVQHLDQSETDPLVYMGPTGRMHMKVPYRELRFPKKPVFAWLWAQWQKGAATSDLKACVDQGNHRSCLTPVTLPIKADLTKPAAKPRGFAMGRAVLWIETKEPAPAAAPAATVATSPAAKPTPKPR